MVRKWVGVVQLILEASFVARLEGEVVVGKELVLHFRHPEGLWSIVRHDAVPGLDIDELAIHLLAFESLRNTERCTTNNYFDGSFLQVGEEQMNEERGLA